MTETNTNSENTNFHENSQEISNNYAEGVGKTLRDARIKQNLDTKAVAQAIKISTKQVEYIENQQWDKLPERMIILGFVRNYARLLKLDENALVQQLSANQNLYKPVSLSIDKGVNFEETPSLKNSSYSVSNSNNKKFVVSIAVIVFVIIAIVLLLVNFTNLSNIADFANISNINTNTSINTDANSVNSTAENSPSGGTENVSNEVAPAAETTNNNISNEAASTTPENNNNNTQQSKPVNPYQ